MLLLYLGIKFHYFSSYEYTIPLLFLNNPGPAWDSTVQTPLACVIFLCWIRRVSAYILAFSYLFFAAIVLSGPALPGKKKPGE